jgi:hypothetical protein
MVQCAEYSIFDIIFVVNAVEVLLRVVRTYLQIHRSDIPAQVYTNEVIGRRREIGNLILLLAMLIINKRKFGNNAQPEFYEMNSPISFVWENLTPWA